RRIVDVQLKRFEGRLARRELRLEVSDGAKDFLGNVGYDPAFGARPLKRAIQQHVETPLAQEILAGPYLPGDTVVLDVRDGNVVTSRRAAPENQPNQGISPQAEA